MKPKRKPRPSFRQLVLDAIAGMGTMITGAIRETRPVPQMVPKRLWVEAVDIQNGRVLGTVTTTDFADITQMVSSALREFYRLRQGNIHGGGMDMLHVRFQRGE